MSLKHTIKLINNHPITSKSKLKTYQIILKWQISQAILRRPILMQFINDSVLLVEKGMTGATGNIYLGLHEFYDMGFLLHFLKKEDVFFDVGANIGAYSILASKVCGAYSYAFEPSKTTFEKLSNNVFLNRINSRTKLFNLGVSSKAETVNFSKGFDTVNHITSKELEYTEKIETTSLNLICEENSIIPTLLKIDVEGFENEVIEGSDQFLRNDQLQAIIIELNGSGQRYGFDEEKIHQKIVSYGFTPCLYDPMKRTITPTTTKNKKDNTLYLKDIKGAQQRVNASNSYKIRDITI